MQINDRNEEERRRLKTTKILEIEWKQSPNDNKKWNDKILGNYKGQDNKGHKINKRQKIDTSVNKTNILVTNLCLVCHDSLTLIKL